MALAATNCGRSVNPPPPLPPQGQPALPPAVARLSDPTIKKLHDEALQLVPRLRRLPRDKERERQLFNMIRIVEYAWAGLLKDQARAALEISQASEFFSGATADAAR